MQLSTKFEFKIPTWALCAIVNGDYDGLTEEEGTKVKAFIAEFGSTCSPINEHEYFSHSNDIDGNLGATVQDYEFVIIYTPKQIDLAKQLIPLLQGASYNAVHKILTEKFTASDHSAALRQNFNSPDSLIYCIDAIQDFQNS